MYKKSLYLKYVLSFSVISFIKQKRLLKIFFQRAVVKAIKNKLLKYFQVVILFKF